MLDPLVRSLTVSTLFIPHGHCYLWQIPLVSLHVISDSLIAIAYYSIPATLFHFVRKRQDLPFDWIFLLFAVFIVACGTTHLVEIWTLWFPTYWMSGILKAITAAVSLCTAVLLVPLVPKALALPSPTQLEEINQKLTREIAEHQKTEAALGDSEARFRSAFDDAAIGMAIATPTGQLLQVNQSLCEVVGYSAEELLDMTFRDITHPDDHSLDADGMHHLLSGRIRTFQQENRYLHKSGQVVWILLSVSLLRNEKQEPQYFIAQMQNINSRKQAEESLQRSEERYRAIVEDQTELICRFKPDATILFVNEAYCRYFNVERNDVIGKSYKSRVYEPDRERVGLLFNSMSAENSIQMVENRVVVGDEVRWTQWNNRMLFDDHGQCIELQSVGRDISALKQAEANIKASLQEKEVLLKEIHHRVKNNLQIVYSLLRLQRRRVSDLPIADVLLESQNRIRSIALIHEKLYCSDNLSKIACAEYIPTLVSNLISTYGTNSNAISLTTQIDEIFLGLDQAIPCGLIINETISNALKHAFPNDMEGQIQVLLQIKGDSVISLVVKDTGVGISNPSLEMFQPKTLGLQLIQDLVQQLEGVLHIDCNGGTAFEVCFPRAMNATV